MPSEKEKTVLKSSEYKIKGNVLRAFYDKHDKLVFVLDYTTSDVKPNVLLVMSSYGDRKWDDVLANDYAVDLETVRPKKDNKYQKLDVEYDGLVVYDNLIRMYSDGQDIKSALHDLDDFRAAAAYRSASERKDVAGAIANKSRETIERTNDTIIELQAKIKALRTKITGLRRGIGREPTKQSAAKILKAEAQMDVLTGKLERAKKRLENANKRLVIAEEDIAAAQHVLDLLGGVDTDVKFKTVETKNNQKIVAQDADDDVEDTDDMDEDLWTDDDDNATDDDDDAEDAEEDAESDEIKPLFDKDPNILDENIAFKPIAFEEKPVAENDDEYVSESSKDDADEKPVVSFEPPKSIMDVVSVPDEYNTDSDVKLDNVFSESFDDEVKYDAPDVAQNTDEPVLNSLKTVEEPKQDEPVEPAPVLTPQQESNDENNTVPVLETLNRDNEIVAPSEPNVVADVQPQPMVSSPVVRPVSPINKSPVITDVKPVANKQNRPNLLYYVLLLVLIGLSVFTLWMYQRSNVPAGAIPELIAGNGTIASADTDASEQVLPDTTDAVKVDDVQIADDASEDESPFVAEGETTGDTGPTMQTVMEDSLNHVAAAADIDMNSAETTETVETNTDATDTNTDAEKLAADGATVNKPEYKVSHENVFANADGLMENDLCEGNAAPDANGCCPGETYSSVNNQMVCCPDDGGDCFPPLF